VKDCMLDLETLGVGTNAVVISIGAVMFDLDTHDRVGETFYTNVNVQSCLDAGLTVNGGTLGFWLKQPDEARLALLSDPIPFLKVACQKFAEYCTRNWAKTLWGNGATFDNIIIRNAFYAVGEQFPVHYRGDRDVRTIVDLAKRLGVGQERTTRVGVHHNALDDAMYQVGYVTDLYRKIKQR